MRVGPGSEALQGCYGACVADQQALCLLNGPPAHQEKTKAQAEANQQNDYRNSKTGA
jgi:hypothetical protein